MAVAAEPPKNPMAQQVREHLDLKQLQERAWRLEAENKELRANNSLLHSQYVVQRETQSELLRNLHGNIDDSVEKIEEQVQTIVRLKERLLAQRHDFEDKLDEERARWEDKVIKLQKLQEDLEDKLNEVGEFRLNKERMSAELEKLSADLDAQAEAHADRWKRTDERNAGDLDEIKKTAHLKVKEMREMLRAKTKDQLDSSTKRTIMENEQMVTELQFQNKEAERLRDSNSKLIEENAQLRKNLALHRDLENELARRTHIYQKLLKKMDQRQKAELESLSPTATASTFSATGSPATSLKRSRSTATARELSKAAAGAREEASKFDVSRELSSAILSWPATPKPDHEAVRRELQDAESTLAEARSEFAQYRRDHDALTELQEQSSKLIISALQDLQGFDGCACRSAPPTGGRPDSERLVNMTRKQKECFFRLLVSKLDRSLWKAMVPPAATQEAARGRTLSAASSCSSLPSVHRSPKPLIGNRSHGALPPFLWSVAAEGLPTPPAPGSRLVLSKGVQTETPQADVACQEGLWRSSSRKALIGDAAPGGAGAGLSPAFTGAGRQRGLVLAVSRLR